VRRKVGVLLCGLAAAAVVGVPAARAANSSVSIQNFSFQPQSVTINVGETVTWTMRDMNTQHTVTADDSSFNSGNLSTNQTFAHTFGQAGSFSYHCNIHPSMTGTVVVQGAAPPPTQPPAPGPAPAPAAPSQPAAAATATAPHTTAAPATTAAPTTTTSSPTTTIAPPAAADTGTTSSTTAAAGGGVALPATQKTSSSSDSVSPWLIAFAVVLVVGAAGGGIYLRRRQTS
jgi:plastocyanin